MIESYVKIFKNIFPGKKGAVRWPFIQIGRFWFSVAHAGPSLLREGFRLAALLTLAIWTRRLIGRCKRAVHGLGMGIGGHYPLIWDAAQTQYLVLGVENWDLRNGILDIFSVTDMFLYISINQSTQRLILISFYLKVSLGAALDTCDRILLLGK